ncbi:MAG: iron ABC transporter permease [Bacteroidia bacterium]|nr:iron ABC transporter permease [Bacteroidia bacterium]
MTKPAKISIYFLLLIIILFTAFIADILFGSVYIDPKSIIENLLNRTIESDPITNDIILNFRLPKAITAILCGASLATAGLLMQTLFRNPLAGPYILGISSGASLGVAILVLAAGSSAISAFFAFSGWGQVIAAIIGASIILMLVLGTSVKINDTVSLLIVGMMFGSLSGAVVNILQSISNPDALKIYIVWTMGSLSSVTWNYMYVMAPILIFGMLISFALQKKLNAMLLGENYARGLGISVFWTRLAIIFATCLLAGASTAFTGPIAFVGIAVPHIIRGIFKTSDHRIILPGCIIGGAALLLICDIASQLPGTGYSLPINSISAIVGAPIILWVIIKNRHLHI